MMASEGDMEAFHETVLSWDHIPILSSTWWQCLMAVLTIVFPGLCSPAVGLFRGGLALCDCEWSECKTEQFWNVRFRG